jgi:hypothetical protein
MLQHWRGDCVLWSIDAKNMVRKFVHVAEAALGDWQCSITQLIFVFIVLRV